LFLRVRRPPFAPFFRAFALLELKGCGVGGGVGEGGDDGGSFRSRAWARRAALAAATRFHSGTAGVCEAAAPQVILMVSPGWIV